MSSLLICYGRPNEADFRPNPARRMALEAQNRRTNQCPRLMHTTPIVERWNTICVTWTPMACDTPCYDISSPLLLCFEPRVGAPRMRSAHDSTRVNGG